MKKYTLLAVLVVLTLTACNDANEENTPQTYTIDFEQVALNEEGRSWGQATNTKDDTDSYDIYSESLLGARFDTWRQETPWQVWLGWAFSNNTQTEYQSDYSHQYASPTGAYSGSKFAIYYHSVSVGSLYTPDIKFNSTVAPKSLMLNNSTTTVCYVKGEDSFSQWSNEDKTTLTITGYRGTTSTGNVEVIIAEGSTYISDWTKVDLTPLGEVNRIELKITSTDTGDWGMNAPAYICIDDIVYEK